MKLKIKRWLHRHEDLAFGITLLIVLGLVGFVAQQLSEGY